MPLILKAATVTPLLKKPELDPENMKNYRPVSNLPYISKLIEKAIVTQLDSHMSENSLHEIHQSAYHKYHSTETALVKIMNDLLCAMDNSQCTQLILLDQSAAFDTVDQEILLQRFEQSYGITGSALQWLRSYFCGRTQSVQIKGQASGARQLDTGFPQGSVLGPFSYPANTSPLFEIARCNCVSMHMYADDTQLYVSSNPRESRNAVQNMKNCTNDLRQWIDTNHLKLNDSKTEYLLIGTKTNLKKAQDLSSITIGSDIISAADCAKNIGAVLDSTLSLSNQVNSITRACYFHLHRIKQIRSFLTQDAAATLVCSLILSRLDYANSLLYGIPDILLNKLQIVQNNAARLILKKKKSDSITPLLIQLHWLPIRFRIQYKIILLTYKALNNQAPPYINSMLEQYQPSRTLRSSSKGLLKEKRVKLKTGGDRAFSVAAPKLWNSLPEEIRMSKTVDSFKGALKTILFRRAYN